MDFSLFQDVVMPPLCPLCKSDVARDGASLCEACEAEMPLLPDRLCRCCGGPNSSPLEICPDCQKEKARLWPLAVTAFPYYGMAQEAIRNFKFHGRLSLAPYLGRRMARAWQEHHGENTVDIVSYIPLFLTRYFQRGFNQSATLAEFVGRELTLPVLRTLLRCRSTARQSGLRREGRLRNIRGAFRAWRPAQWQGKHILLIDDVFTTGATLQEATHVLLAGGAAEVSVLTAARD